MVDPDIELAGEAVGRAGSTFDRRRSPLLLTLGVLLLAGGLLATGFGTYQLATEAGPSDSRTLVRGTAAALGASPTVETFDHSGKVTIWLEVDNNEEVADTEVAGTICHLSSAGEDTQTIRGNRQGSSLEIESQATVGEAIAKGRTMVSCERFPYGPRSVQSRLEKEDPFLVEAGTPGDGLRGLWLLLPGTAAAIAAIPVLVRAKSGSLKRRRP